jgi:peptidyl-prolyl cis-trans isomerase B (cyclophilin B)
MKKILCLVLTIAAVLCMSACGDEKKELEPVNRPEVTIPATVEEVKGKYMVEISVVDYGKIRVELDGDVAPITVHNFLHLANSGFYDGLTFHRIIKNFMIQGGDPNGDGTGGSDVKIKGEFKSNGVDNPLKHTRGAISMARTSIKDSATSQFFIVHQDSDHLDGNYACFGYVTEGMDVVDAIATGVRSGSNGAVSKNNQPVIHYIIVLPTE